MVSVLEIERGKTYRRTAIGTLIGRAVWIFGGFLVIASINDIAGQEAVGAYAISLVSSQLTSYLSTIGIDRALLYSLSSANNRDADSPHPESALRYAFAVSMSSTIVFLLAIFYLLESNSFASYDQEMELLRKWFPLFASMVVVHVIDSVMTAYSQAIHHMLTATIIPRFGDIFRSLVLWLIYSTDMASGMETAQFGLIAGTALHLLLWLTQIPKGLFRLHRKSSKPDILYGINLMFAKLAQIGVQRIDVIMVGAFLGSKSAGIYFLSTKLASLALLGHELLGFAVTPRFALLRSMSSYALQREYNAVRLGGFAIALMYAVLFLAIEPTVNAILGNYIDSIKIAFILLIGHIVSTSCGPIGRYLNMTGRATTSLINTNVLLLTVIILNYLLIPHYGLLGAAFATAIAYAIYNIVNVFFAYRYDRLKSLDLASIAAVIMFSIILAQASTVPQTHYLYVLIASSFLTGFFYFKKRDLIILSQFFITKMRKSE